MKHMIFGVVVAVCLFGGAGCSTLQNTKDYRIVLYDEDNFQGAKCIVEGKDAPNLLDWQFNDKTSSIEVSKGIWSLYEHVPYKGLANEVSDNGGPNGDGKYPSFKDWNGMNNAISSVRRGGLK